MTAETAVKLQKVKRYSASLRNLFLFLFVLGAAMWLISTIIALEGAFVHAGFGPPDAVFSEPSVRIGGTEYRGDAVSGGIRALGIVFFTLNVALALTLTLHLVQLFDLYAEGKIFSAENVRQIRRIGITLMLFPALAALGLLVPLVAPSEGTSNGARTVAEFVGSIQSLVIGFIVLVVSWVMDVGRELREEQDLVV
jgi:DUF2975 family protein